MAFSFLSGQNTYDPFSPYQQSFYNDPRRKGAQGSFNPYALSNFGAMQKGGAQDPTKQPAATSNPNLPQIGTVKPPGSQPNGAPSTTYAVQPGTPPPLTPGSQPNGAPSTTYAVQPGTPPPLTPGSGPAGTPINKPGYTPGAPGSNSGAINYGQFGSVQDVYANNPQGLPAGWDWNEWSRVTGQQNPMLVTASGDPVRFTWNPDGPGFIDPYTGETFDKPGETYASPPPPPRTPYTPPAMPNINFGGFFRR